MAEPLPTQMYDEEGVQVWERSLDMNGRVVTGDNNACPFTFQGQEFDKDIELCYNRMRWYSEEDGRYISKDIIGLFSNEFNFYSYVDDSNLEIDGSGLAKSSAYKNAWNKARRDFWKNEVKSNPGKYSPRNQKRMKKGLAPQMRVKVRNRKTGKTSMKNVSMELEHTYLKQRGGSLKAHESWNLTKSTPWGHEAMDPYRHTGYDVIKVTKGVNSF